MLPFRPKRNMGIKQLTRRHLGLLVPKCRTQALAQFPNMGQTLRLPRASFPLWAIGYSNLLAPLHSTLKSLTLGALSCGRWQGRHLGGRVVVFPRHEGNAATSPLFLRLGGSSSSNGNSSNQELPSNRSTEPK